ncbi:MAG: flagellar basal body L-ring protein FlgH [Betaproteobacteria bacterium]|nr:flagellar basal body L-ring protein FlgH [Betaproteobacteria bacterium]
MKTVAIAVVLFTAGCVLDPKIEVREPTSVVPQASVAQAPSGGAVYNESRYRSLFEDRRARQVGDIVYVTISEKLSASRKASSTTSRSGDTSIDMPGIRGAFGKNFNGAQFAASTGNKFDGKGETSSDNVFSGTITTTVIEVLPNGNLVLAGEKRLGVNRNAETLRFSGVLNPASLAGASGGVSSDQLADLRLEYKGGGITDEAQNQGWLARLFQLVSPF